VIAWCATGFVQEREGKLMGLSRVWKSQFVTGEPVGEPEARWSWNLPAPKLRSTREKLASGQTKGCAGREYVQLEAATLAREWTDEREEQAGVGNQPNHGRVKVALMPAIDLQTPHLTPFHSVPNRFEYKYKRITAGKAALV
jgi:hypothetical protein